MILHRFTHLAFLTLALLAPGVASADPVCNADRFSRGPAAIDDSIKRGSPEDVGRIAATLLGDDNPRKGKACPGLPNGLREGLASVAKVPPAMVNDVVAAILDEPDVAPLVAALCKQTDLSSLGKDLASDYARCGIGTLGFATQSEFVSASPEGGGKRLTVLAAVVYKLLVDGKIDPAHARIVARALGGLSVASLVATTPVAPPASETRNENTRSTTPPQQTSTLAERATKIIAPHVSILREAGGATESLYTRMWELDPEDSKAVNFAALDAEFGKHRKQLERVEAAVLPACEELDAQVRAQEPPTHDGRAAGKDCAEFSVGLLGTLSTLGQAELMSLDKRRVRMERARATPKQLAAVDARNQPLRQGIEDRARRGRKWQDRCEEYNGCRSDPPEE